jgi:uncharacterized membrane protein (DUF106 family)
MNRIDPLDRARDLSVRDANKQLKDLTAIQKFVEYFKSLFKSANPKNSENELSRIQNEIRDTQNQLDYVTNNAPFLQKILITLLSVVLLYLVGSVLGNFIHSIAFIILIAGLLYSFYSS